MSNATAPVVSKGSYLTLHYRLASEHDEDIVNTFNETPATIHIGEGHMSEGLESCLVGLAEGVHTTFDLPDGQAFGERNPDLIQYVSRDTLMSNSDMGEEYRLGDLVEFAAPTGEQFAGVIIEMGDERILFDFNHPMAGRPVKFEVKIISVM